MSRSDGEPRAARRRTRALGWRPLALILVLSSASAAVAQPAPGATAEILASPQVRYSLSRLQEGWLEWTRALYSNDAEGARETVDELAEIVRRLGMETAPDLAAGALVQAVESASAGEEERARLALEAAERLAPGRPETAFATAEVARLTGDWPGALVAEGRGYARLPRTVLERELALYDLALWGLASVLLAAGLFVLLEAAWRGPAVGREIASGVGSLLRRAPRRVAAAALAVALLWPLLLPGGLLWLVLYWSLLLWGHVGRSERAVFALGWLALALAPAAASAVDARVALALSPSVRAMESVARGSLYGGLFTDLGVLPASLPEHPGVDHLLADVHLRLGQWEEARQRYARVLDAEPENASALVNLGAYHFQRGDYGAAGDAFRRATAVAEAGREERAAAWFDLSHAYADSNLFEEQREAFTRARETDDARVNLWRRRPENQKIVTVEGGIARVDEIVRALAARRPAEGGSPALALLRASRPILLVLFLAAAAVAAHAVGRSRRRPPGGEPEPEPPRTVEPGLRVLVPGLASVAAGRGVRAYGALLLLAAPLVVLVAGPDGPGYELPWRHDPLGWLLPALAVAALVGPFGLRWARSGRDSGRAR